MSAAPSDSLHPHRAASGQPSTGLAGSLAGSPAGSLVGSPAGGLAGAPASNLGSAKSPGPPGSVAGPEERRPAAGSAVPVPTRPLMWVVAALLSAILVAAADVLWAVLHGGVATPPPAL